MNGIEIDEEAIKRVVDKHLKQFWQQEKLEEKKNLKEENYNYRFQILSLLLERYVDYPAGSRKKIFIDHIMERHRSAYREGITEDFYKVRHNLLVLRFLLPTPIDEKSICQKLGIKKAVYQKNLRKGIEELMIYAFGVDGLPPW